MHSSFFPEYKNDIYKPVSKETRQHNRKMSKRLKEVFTKVDIQITITYLKNHLSSSTITEMLIKNKMRL